MCKVTLTAETRNKQTPKNTFYLNADKGSGLMHVGEHTTDSSLINGNIWVAP